MLNTCSVLTLLSLFTLPLLYSSLSTFLFTPHVSSFTSQSSSSLLHLSSSFSFLSINFNYNYFNSSASHIFFLCFLFLFCSFGKYEQFTLNYIILLYFFLFGNIKYKCFSSCFFFINFADNSTNSSNQSYPLSPPHNSYHSLLKKMKNSH